MRQEDFDALGYPQVPQHMTKEWMLEQIELEKVDPRVNPNLLLEETSQEFWDNMSRKPYAKAILRSEKHWSQRRRLWMRQLEAVSVANERRAEAIEALEECGWEVKRMLAPIMRYKITELALCHCLATARQQRVPLEQVLRRPEEALKLESLRRRLEEGGAPEAERMLAAFAATAKVVARPGTVREHVLDSDSMAKLMTKAQKLRKDGYISWHEGLIEEAMESWCEAEACLYRKRLRPEEAAGNRMVHELQLVLLKNISQAALRLGHWSDALQAADEALALDEEDLKAWFRRAAALEGLGRCEEAGSALDAVERLAVGRVDRPRVAREVLQRRQRLGAWEARQAAMERRAAQRALRRGVFAREERELEELEEELRQLEAEAAEAEAVECDVAFAVGDRVVTRSCLGDLPEGHGGRVVEVDKDGDAKVLFDGQTEAQLIFSVDFDQLCLESEKAELKILTLEGASDLLEALAVAYEDPGFQAQLKKLCRDLRYDAAAFGRHLPTVALWAQAAVLPRFGFEATVAGAKEAEQAVKRAALAAPGEAQVELRRRSDAVTRLLYGEMHPVVFER